MINKIEHIGIAVRDLNTAVPLFEKLLGTPPYKTETVTTENVITVFFQVGETKIELLQATHPDSAIHKFIEQRGEGIHHIAFDTDAITQDLARLANSGFQLIHPQPKPGADNKQIAFLHPKSTGGVLTELCQSLPTVAESDPAPSAH
jgi:methylmalonyl-CoA/ethylmalonyl-CoA epimerase